MPSTTPRNDPAESLLLDRPRVDAAEVSGWLIGLYFLLIVGGFLALRRPEVMPRGNQLNVDRAFFAAVNAGTLSGFQQTIGVAQSRPLGQAIAFALTVSGSLLVMIVGGLAVKRVAGSSYSDKQIVIGALVIEAGAIIIGGGMLLTPERGFFPSAFQSASAFGNAGTIIGPLSSPFAWRTHAVLMPLALLGSFGVPVLLDLRDWLFKGGTLSRFSRIVIGATAGAYLCGFIAMVAVRLPDHWVTIGRWMDIAIESSVASTNARLAGLPYSWAGRWPRAAQWAVMLLMFVGGTSGGLAGGLKLTTLVELTSGIRSSLRGELAGRLFGIAALWTLGYITLIVVTLLLLTSFEPETPADRLLFLAISAAGNVGLSHDTISSTGPSLFVLSIAMLVGRIAPLMFLWWTARTVRDTGNAVG